MQLKYAKKLHNEDEVKIKNTKEIKRVIQTKNVYHPYANKLFAVEILLDDGRWYNHKDVE